jgi:hypothetical protein
MTGDSARSDAAPAVAMAAVAAELRTLGERLIALAERIESDPAAAQEPLAREAYRLRRLTQEVAAGLAERRLAEVPAAPSPTRRWCG